MSSRQFTGGGLVAFARASLALIGILVAASCTEVKVGPAATLTVISGNDQVGTVDEPLADALAVRVEDADGHAVAGQAVSFVVTLGGGTMFAASSTTDEAGVASNTWTLGTSTASGQKAEARVVTPEGTQLTAEFDATAIAGAASMLVYTTQPADGGYGVVLEPIVVAVTDEFGNTVTTDSRPVTLAVPGTSLSPVLVNAVGGVATFDDVVISEPASAYTAVASAASLTSATSDPFSIDAIGTVATPLQAQSLPPTIVLDGSNVYVAEAGPAANGGSSPDFYLMRSAKSGGGVTRINRIGVADRATSLGKLTLRGSSIDVTSATTSNVRLFSHLAVVKLDGSSVLNVEATSGTQTDFTGECIMKHDAPTDGTYDFIACATASNSDYYAPSLIRVDPTTGTQVTLAAATLALAHAVSGGFVYYLNDSVTAGPNTNQYSSTGILSIRRVNVAGGSPDVIVTGLGRLGGSQPRRLAIASGTFYWAENGGGTASGSVCKAPLAGGTPTGCIGGFSSVVSDFLVDDDYLYVNDNGAIKRIHLSDDVVSTVVGAAEKVADFALDASNIYWTTGVAGRLVRKTAKP